MVKERYYAFPAVFTIDHEDNNAVLVSFPDLENCFADGNTLAEAAANAQEALENVLYWMEHDGQTIPKATRLTNVTVADDEEKSLIIADMARARRLWENKAVNRTITLPAWLDELARQNNVNVSQITQNSLREVLHVNEA